MNTLSRRAVLGAVGLGLAALPFTASARVRPAGPLATRDRKALFRRLADYLALVDRGDAGQRAFLAGPAPARPAVPPARKTTLLNVALDDSGNMLAAEFRIESLNSPPDFGVSFFRIANGYITEIMQPKEGVQLVRGGAGDRSAPPAAMAPLPASVILPRMTRAKFADYLELFRRFDERFTYYYADDVVFAASPAPAPLRGREAVLELYRPLRKNLGEQLTVHELVIDSHADLMIAAVSNQLTAYGKVVLPSTVLEAGDQMLLSGALVYELKDGRISKIRDVGG